MIGLWNLFPVIYIAAGVTALMVFRAPLIVLVGGALHNLGSELPPARVFYVIVGIIAAGGLVALFVAIGAIFL